ncbi:MAG: glycosyl hydrolase [Chitinophagaceae bacterium]|nr:glycosyl hydrolase [Chitinophagaceae bacterium]
MRGIFIFLLAAAGPCVAQKAYFIDGYHGGIYGHIPSWQTRFMVDKLKEYPDWRINLELEPESWDTIKVRDRASYDLFREVMALSDTNKRVEYVNPSYGQSYLWNISGESIIRQFHYGIRKLREHFPSLAFTTYSSEEPCFTSALPQLLRSYGFRYASLKNPNTCWGGYTRAFGGELVDWIGPDGSRLLTVPRYEMEALQPNSTWQTIAFDNSAGYVEKAFAAGIRHPVGMTLQDAGWGEGPWLRGKKDRYVTWREYFEKVADTSLCQPWKFSQEDVLVSLMWGAQVLQRIARSVRSTENVLVQSEKVAAMRCIGGGDTWPGDSLDAAWRTLLLSQHHDCWIVPYNGKAGDTWADKVARWTGHTRKIAEGVIYRGRREDSVLTVYNTTGVDRKEWVEVGGKVFKVNVPAMGYAVYRAADVYRGQDRKGDGGRKVYVVKQSDGVYRIETDLYRILIDTARGGSIRSLRAKRLGNKEFVKDDFNALRGNFYKEGGFKASTAAAARVRIVESGGPRVRVEIQGTIAGRPFTQLLTVTEGEPRIDCHLHIDWKDNPGIGESGGASPDREARKAYYDDRYKLLALFPPAFTVGKVYKNAPFDVTESRLSNTFFSRWDSIKNNVLLNWVDVEDKEGAFGLALFCDHTTSYVQGEDYPLGLTVQYSGNGIFYRNYSIDGPTDVDYAWVPHAGRWSEAGIERASMRWNEPLLVVPGEGGGAYSFLRVGSKGWEVTSMRMDGKDLLVRIYNAAGDNRPGKVRLGFKADEAWVEELDGRRVSRLPMKGNFELSLPRYGIRTLRFINVRI